MNKYWLGTTSVWSNAANWSTSSGGTPGAMKPTSGDVAIFDGGGTGNCTLDEAVSCDDISAVAGYTGNFDQAGYAITIAGSFIWYGVGNLTVDGLITLAGNYEADDNISTYLQSGLELTFTASASVIINAIQTDQMKRIYVETGLTLTFADNIILRNDGGNSIYFESGCTWAMGSRDCSIYSTGTLTGSNRPIILNGSTVTATSENSVIRITPSGNSTVDVFDGDFSSANGRIELGTTNAEGESQTYNLTGDIITNRLTIGRNEFGGVGSTVTLNMVTYDVSASESLYYDTIDPGTHSETVTVNLGTGTHTFGTITGSSDEEATWVLNMDSSTVKITGNLDFTDGSGEPRPDTWIINAGTSTLEFTGTSTQTLTSNGATFNIVKTTNTSGELRFGDASHCARYDFASGTTVKFKEGVIHELDSYTSGDIDGSTLRSLSDGTQWDFDNPAGMAVTGVDTKDSDAVLNIDAYTAVNTDSGNNSAKWLFSAPSTFQAAWAKGSNQILINGEQL